MGKVHFDSMMADAMELDMYAMQEALQRVLEARRASGNKLLPAFWEQPFDRCVALCRKLHALDARYVNRLQELLVAGRIPVKLRSIADGKMYDVRDPRLFTFDDERPPVALLTFMMICPP